MKAYRLHEADIQLPDDWKDNTMNIFMVPAEDGNGSANLVVTRDCQTQSKDVQSYADRQLSEAAKTLRNFKLIARRPIQIGGRHGVEARFTWAAQKDAAIHQRQAYVRHGSAILVFTLSAKVNEQAGYEKTWNEIVRSVRLRAA